MVFLMSFFIRKVHKVFNMVIRFIFVDMMDSFFGSKISSKMFFHYKTMLIDICNSAHLFTIRMIFAIYLNITSSIFIPSTFPSRASFFNIFSQRNTITLFVTVFSLVYLNSRWVSFKFFFTIQTFLNHNYLQIKRAAFGGLKETVTFLHLLTAQILDKINLSPSSTYIIAQRYSLSIGVNHGG